MEIRPTLYIPVPIPSNAWSLHQEEFWNRARVQTVEFTAVQLGGNILAYKCPHCHKSLVIHKEADRVPTWAVEEMNIHVQSLHARELWNKEVERVRKELDN